MLVLVAPGQGAQSPGFLTPWLDLPGAADQLRHWSDAIDLDLVHYGTEADADAIRDTAVAQPLLIASALLSANALLGELPADGGTIGATAGHSVGELAAAAICGVLSPEGALRLARQRGQAMAEAAAAAETGMSAVLGGEPEEVLAQLEKLGLIPANVNGGGQIVAAGTAAQLAELGEAPPARAKVRPLKVAGAFHTVHMEPAVEVMRSAAADVAAADPVLPYVSNADAAVVDSGREVLERLVQQVSTPVRWDRCMETFEQLGATALVELCPGGTLTGLAKRAMPEVTRVALKKPDDLATARELITAGHAADTGPSDGASADPS